MWKGRTIEYILEPRLQPRRVVNWHELYALGDLVYLGIRHSR